MQCKVNAKERCLAKQDNTIIVSRTIHRKMKHHIGVRFRRPMQTIVACYCFAVLLAAQPHIIQARTWWSIEIPALQNIRNDHDPLYAPSSTLLMEDTSFVYGSFQLVADEDHSNNIINTPPGSATTFEPMEKIDPTFDPKQEGMEDPFMTYSTPAPYVMPLVIDVPQEQEEAHQQPLEEDELASSASPAVITASSPSSRPNSINIEATTDTNANASITATPNVQMVGPFPTPEPIPSPETTTVSPVVDSTDFPTSEQPTFSPSKHYEAANGSCPPNHSLHRLWLYDSVGDGWGSTKLVIKETSTSSSDIDDAIFVGTLDVTRGVIKYALTADASMSDAHDKNSKREPSASSASGNNNSDANNDTGSPEGANSMAKAHVKTNYQQDVTSSNNPPRLRQRGLSMAAAFRGNNDAHTKINNDGQSMADAFQNSGHSESNNSDPTMAAAFQRFRDTPSDADVTDDESSSGTDSSSVHVPSSSTADAFGVSRVQKAPSWNEDNFSNNGNGGIDASESPVVFNESVYLCLKQEDVCYTAKVSGGTFLQEVSWEVTRVELGTGENVGLVAKGVGDGSGTCDFSLDDICVKTCDGTAQIPQPTASPNTPSPSQSPSTSPIDNPTHSPSIYLSRKPTTPSPSEVLPQDKAYAFGIEEYRRLRDVLLSASPSSEEVMADESSPQHRAFDWIYDSNASGLSDRRLVQRWVLASFYYATNGDGWVENAGWVKPNRKDECAWHGVSCLDGIISKLELEQNRLVGEFIPELALWGNNLYVLSLGNNYDTPEDERNEFVNPLPLFLGDLTYLTYLNLEGVGLISTIPEYLFQSWPHLESLYLNDNDITGELPKSIQHLNSIEVMWLGGNNIGGSIIPEIGQLTSLKDLSLESNFRKDALGQRGFITTVPSEIGQLTNLEVLSLADNALSGSVPLQLGDLISLRRLQLSGNFFENQLPTALGRLEMLEELDISSNWLSSTIPPEYGNLISLTSLSLQSNYNDNDGYFTWGIKKKLPPEISLLKNLQHINLSDNYLTGTLITEIGQLYLLQTLNLQNNFLQGPIPEEYANCVQMKEILLQDNNIDGESFGMPEEICRLPDLDLARVDCEVSCSCCLTTC